MPFPPRPPSFVRASLLALLASAAIGVTRAQTASPVVYPNVEGLTKVRGLDIALDGGAIHALLAGKFAQRATETLAYAASRDGGKTWSKPAFLERTGEPAVLSRRGNDPLLAVQGKRIVAVWQAKGALPGTGPLRSAASDDAGKTWSLGGTPAQGDGTHNQSHPALALDQAGNVHLAWLDDREENGNTQGLRYAKSADGGRHWQPETTLDAAACTCCWNRLAVLPDGEVAVLYRDAEPHDMRLAVLAPGTGKWRDAGAVGAFGWHFSGCPHCGGGLAAAKTPGGMALHSVVWTGRETAPGLFYLNSADAGKTWSPPLRIGDGDSREGDIAALSPTKAALVFTRIAEEGAKVYATHSLDGGRHWSEPVALSPPGIDADHPRILATAAGFRVFWTETRPGGGKVFALAALSIPWTN